MAYRLGMASLRKAVNFMHLPCLVGELFFFLQILYLCITISTWELPNRLFVYNIQIVDTSKKF